MAAWLADFKRRARALKQDVHALYLAARDPRTPWYAKALVGMVVAYALSPIDLIPDFIPVLGLLDDLLLLPAGIALAIRMIPRDVLADAREQARAHAESGAPTSRTAAVVIVGVWLVVLLLAIRWGARFVAND